MCVYTCIYTQGFPGSSAGKESACNAGDPSSIPGSERSPGEGHRNPLQYSCLENSHGRRSLVSYSPWGYEKSDTSERLSTTQDSIHTHTHTHTHSVCVYIYINIFIYTN